MWNDRKSVTLSAILVYVVLAAVLVAAFLAPSAIRQYVEVTGDTDIVPPLYITLYASLAMGLLAAVKLISLLTNIKRDEVFTEKNIANLRALSWCCFAVAALYFSFGFIRPITFVISFAAAFLGLILRVVKNVFAKAVELREENDATI